MNRQQRRAAKKTTPKKKPSYHNLTPEQKREALFKNGITDKDLKKSYEDGYAQARKELTGFTMRMFYCATGCALHEIHHFGQDRIVRVLDRIQEIMTEEICTQDIIERLKRETGLDIFDSDYDN